MLSGLKKRYSESHFVLHGLWPQPKNKLYCNVEKRYITIDRYKKWYKLPNLGLSQETKESLKKIMPGFYSNLHKHEWFKHGTCYGTTAESYYLDAIHLVNQVNSAKVGTFFIKHIGKSVTLKQIRYVFDSSFGTGAGKRVEMKCKNGLIVELWLHLGGEGDSLIERLKQGKSTRSRCQKGRIDRVGFGR
jgi:ribonuclease T2